MKKINDMTEGAPLSLLIRFAIPIMISDVFYQLYILADGIVAGRLIGINALAAISASGIFYSLILEAFIGFSHGAGIRFAQLYGAKRFEDARSNVAMTIVIGLFIGTFFSIVCVLLTKPVLAAMNTPTEIINDSAIYLYCLFAGLIPTFIYRMVNSIAFSMGDSKSPLATMVLSSVMNAVINIALVLGTSLGVAALGISTILSQLVACAFLSLHILKNKELALTRYDFRINFIAIKAILRIGWPISARNTVSALGGIVIQYVINGYGVAFITGIAVAKRLYTILFIVASAMEPAVVTFIAQNFGARKMARVKEGMQAAKKIMLISVLSIMVVMFLFGPWFLRLFLADEADIMMVLSVALSQLRVCIVFLPMLYLLILYRSGLQGMGKTTSTLISGILEGMLRIATILILPTLLGEMGIYISEIIAWPVCALQLFLIYSATYRKALLIDKKSPVL